MITKALLSQVLGLEIVDFVPTYIYGGIHLRYHEKHNKPDMEINIHELAYKCKQWAKTHTLVSSYWYENGEEGAWCCLHKDLCTTEGITFTATTEPEAIFAACEWILNNKGEQC